MGAREPAAAGTFLPGTPLLLPSVNPSSLHWMLIRNLPPTPGLVPQMQWRPTGPGRALRWRTCRARGGPKPTDPLLTSPLEGLPPLSPPRGRAQRGRLTSPASHSTSQMAGSGVQVGKTPTTACRGPPDQLTPRRPRRCCSSCEHIPGPPQPLSLPGTGPQHPLPHFSHVSFRCSEVWPRSRDRGAQWCHP